MEGGSEFKYELQLGHMRIKAPHVGLYVQRIVDTRTDSFHSWEGEPNDLVETVDNLVRTCNIDIRGMHFYRRREI
jgi:hypothetical protein